MKPLVIFHGPGCMDGAAAALAAYLKFGEDAEYRPAQYGDPAPTDEEVRGRDVYVLDFSYPRAELERMERVIEQWTEHDALSDNRLRVIDHHKTAQADLAGLPFCTFDMSKSGAVLAWEHFAKPVGDCACCESAEAHEEWFKSTGMRVHVPELFAYVQDRDLWQWKLPHSREVSAALAASGALTDFRKLIPIYELSKTISLVGHLASEGAAILRAERLMVERIVASAEEVEIRHGIDGYPRWVFRVLAATSAVLQSEVGEALALESVRRGRDAVGAVYYRDGKAGKWRVSLRSRDTVEQDERANAPVPAPDVSAIAKSFGGGGHARAAGFECDVLPWVRS